MDYETAFSLLDDLSTPMSVAQVTACAHKFCDFWLEDAAPFDSMLQWIAVKFELDATADFEWEEFDISFETHRVRIQHINTYSDQITDETLQTRLERHARALLGEDARPADSPPLQPSLPRQQQEVTRPATGGEKGSLAPEHLYIHDKVKLNSFQNLFLHLRERLEGMQYRRAKGFFYVRKVIPCGIKSQAFTQAISVRDFIKRNTSHGSDWEAWRWCTDSRANFEHGVEYLTDRSLPRGARPEGEPHASLVRRGRAGERGGHLRRGVRRILPVLHAGRLGQHSGEGDVREEEASGGEAPSRGRSSSSSRARRPRARRCACATLRSPSRTTRTGSWGRWCTGEGSWRETRTPSSTGGGTPCRRSAGRGAWT